MYIHLMLQHISYFFLNYFNWQLTFNKTLT
jgi:hypothetical protein